MTYVYDEKEYENLEDAVKDVFDSLSENEKVLLWNEFCEAEKYYDSRIYDMDELDYIYSDSTPSEILELARGNDFNPNDSYFRETTYGIESADYPDDWIEYSDMKDWLLSRYDSLDIEEKDEDEE